MAEEINERADFLAKDFAEILEGLLNREFELPYYFAAISINGSILAGRYEASPGGSGLSAEIIAEHVPSGMFVLPINFMFVDRTGNAARMFIGKPGKVEFMN